jgi:transcriptional regulator with XRE-family HTH domain
MNLRELRKEKGWSQGDLSNLTGLSARTSSTVLKTAGRGDRKEERGYFVILTVLFSSLICRSANYDVREIEY